MEKQTSNEIDLGNVLKVILKHKLIILIVMIVCAAGAYCYARFAVVPQYTASAYLYVNNNRTNLDSYTIAELNASQTLADTYAVIAKTRTVLESAQTYAETDYSLARLEKMVSIEVVNETPVIMVSVTSSNAEEAQKLCNGITEAIPSFSAEIIVGADARIVEEAEYPSNPANSNRTSYAIIGALAGLVLICLILVIIDQTNDCVPNADYLQSTFTNIPLLAKIPDILEDANKSRSGKHLTADDVYLNERSYICDNMTFGVSEAYKFLRASLAVALGNTTGSKMIGITSANNHEGKSICAINTSYSFSLLKNTVLLEGDLRIPTLAKRLSLRRTPGLTEIVSGNKEIVEATQHSGINESWDVITSGNRPANPTEVLASDGTAGLLQQLSNSYDYVVMDLPPANELSDAVIASRMLDGIVVVVKEGETSKKSLNATIEKLNQANATVLGFALVNSADGDSAYGKGGRYGKYGKYGKYSKYSKYSKYATSDRYARAARQTENATVREVQTENTEKTE